MKIKLTPELSYIIGLWSRRRCAEGLGIEAGKELQQIFAQTVLEQKLTETDKLLSDENRIYFYHGKYRKFFQEIEQEKLERYKYINEYSANYLAGVFDAAGGISEQGVIYLERFGTSDEVLLLRLGFPPRKIDGKMAIGRPRAFLAFIKNYTRVFSGHPAMGMLKGKKRGEGHG
jgi:hypothetical protein